MSAKMYSKTGVKTNLNVLRAVGMEAINLVNSQPSLCGYRGYSIDVLVWTAVEDATENAAFGAVCRDPEDPSLNKFLAGVS